MRAGLRLFGLLAFLGGGAVLPIPFGGGGIVRAQAGDPVETSTDEDVEPEPTGPRVLVMVLPVGGEHAATADALTELLIGAVATSGRASSILGKEELQAQLEQTDTESLDCIGSRPCLSRVGVQLGVAEVVAGTIARRDERWVFDLHRLDARSGESLRHVFREVDGGIGELADAMTDALGQLDEPEPRLATLRIAVDVEGAEVAVDGEVVGVYAGTPLVVEDLAPGVHRVRATAPDREPWTHEVELAEGDSVRIEAGLTRRIPEPVPPPPPAAPAPVASPERGWSPVLWAGLGLSAVAGGFALGFGISSGREPADGVNRAEALAFVADRRRDARIANASMGLTLAGLGVTGVGLWLSLREPAAGGAGQRLGVAPRAGGLAIDWSGRW